MSKPAHQVLPRHIAFGAVLLLVFLVASGSTASAQTYVFNQATFTVGTNPQWITVADLNGDGKPDLAVVNGGSDSISILLGKPDGTFQPHLDYLTGNGSSPGSIAVGDFNGVGVPDLAVTLWQGMAVAIFIGNGDGTFQAPVKFALGENPEFVTVGDFNGDGKLDLAVTKTTSTSGDVAILLGNGDGTFQPHVDNPASSDPYGLVAVDVNGDGKLDLLVGSGYSNAVTVYIGNGDSTFQPYVNCPANAYAGRVAVGDFNNDGRLDLVSSKSGNRTVSVLLGNGDENYGAPERKT